VERQLALALAPAQPDPDLGDPHRDGRERDGCDADAYGVARGEVAQLGVVLGAQGRDPRFDGAARDLAARASGVGDQRPEVLVDARPLAVVTTGDRGADLVEPRPDRLRAADGEGPRATGRAAGVALFGMVPNCAASVAITQAFLRAGLPFGTAVAGLSAGAGLGPIVLFREAGVRQGVLVLFWLGIASIVAGLAIDWIYPLSLPIG
jgi:hypothetical protein